MLKPPRSVPFVSRLKRSLATLSLFSMATLTGTSASGEGDPAIVLAEDSSTLASALKTPVLSQQEDAPVSKDAVPASCSDKEEEDAVTMIKRMGPRLQPLDDEVDCDELELPLTMERQKQSRVDHWGAAYVPHKRLKLELTKTNAELLIERLEHQAERAALSKRVFELEAAEAAMRQLYEDSQERLKQLQQELFDSRCSLEQRERILETCDKLIEQLRSERRKEGEVISAISTLVNPQCDKCNYLFEAGDDLVCWSCYDKLNRDLIEREDRAVAKAEAEMKAKIAQLLGK